MPWKYYLVVVKCGHVRRSQYILKAFPIRAFDGKDAARIARNKARVKHDDKYAIVSVNELSKEQYDIEKKKFSEDNYHKVHSIQEQKMLCPNIYLEVLKEDTRINRLGLEIPFMVDLSLKLGFYDLLTNIETDMDRMVDTLWK